MKSKIVDILKKSKLLEKNIDILYEKLYFSGKTNFVSNHEMISMVDEWVSKFDKQYDLIIGIPRSGLLIAALVATKLARPLGTPEGNYWLSKSIQPREVKNILLIDDCVTTGNSLNSASDLIRAKYPNAAIYKGVLFAQNNNTFMVDTYYKVAKGPQIYQWNLMHCKIGPTGFDMDGVLCSECPNDSDEWAYEYFLNTASPYLIPEYEIDYIITSRLEKYRPQTEKWLKDHNVKYKKLIMWDLPDKSMRDGAGTYKSRIIKDLDIALFLESNLQEAEEIWNKTKVWCLCTNQMKMFD